MKPKKRTHTSITGKSMFGTDAEFYLAFVLPYARWTCADGREILVNAFGEPIWQRRPRGEATPADPYERVRDVVWVERVYGDAYRHHEKRSAAKNWLENFRTGMPITQMSEGRQRPDSAGVHDVSGGGLVQDNRRRSA